MTKPLPGADRNDAARPGEGPARRWVCSQVEERLFEYIDRTMPPADADSVREHLVRCTKCRTAVGEIEAALGVLKNAHDSEGPAADRLSDRHRARLHRAIEHPFIDWLARYHTVVAVLIALAVIVLSALALCRGRPWGAPEKSGTYTVQILLTPAGENEIALSTNAPPREAPGP